MRAQYERLPEGTQGGQRLRLLEATSAATRAQGQGGTKTNKEVTAVSLLSP